MLITVEISLYPLDENFKGPINDFIARLRTHKGLEIVTNATSTQIVGEHSAVFNALTKETAVTFEQHHSVFVMKVLGFERDITKPPKI